MKNKRLFLIYLLCAALATATYMLLSANPRWTLFPYAKALELLFGFHFYYSGEAYLATGSSLAITKACSGVNLFLSLYAILAAGFLHRLRGNKKRVLLALFYFAGAILVAFISTLVRIIVSLPFCESPHFKLIHTAISLCVFFGTGLLVYSLMQKTTDKFDKGGHTLEETV